MTKSISRYGPGGLAALLLLGVAVGCGGPAGPDGGSSGAGALEKENLELKMMLAEHQKELLPTVRVPRCTTPPQIDGRADDAAWAGAADLMFDTNPWAARGFEQEPATHVKVLYDEKFLYVLYRVEGGEWAASEKEHDGKVYDDERVEVFLDTDERDDFYDCVEVNPLGTVLDYACDFYRGYQRDWSPESLQAAGGKWEAGGKTIGYVVEVRVPWNAVTAKKFEGGKVIHEKEVPFDPKPGTVLGAGFYRIHIVADGAPGSGKVKETYSLWRPPWSSFPDYHLVSTFGKMVLE